MFRYTSLCTAITYLSMQGMCFAADNTVDDDELARLMAVIDEQTEIATKSRLNADFVPSIVTVLRGRELESRGIRNVWEALALVPGIELGMEESGRRHIMIRGVGLTYASEAAKIMVDGIAYNTTSYSFADTVFTIPIVQVERIEVIRGPGSALYGEYAYSGVINVITSSGESRLIAQASSLQHRLGGGIYSFGERSSGRLYGTISIAGENSGGADVSSGYDAAYQLDPSWSYAPGTSNEVAQTRSAMLNLGYDNFALKMAWLSNGFGDHFGINSELPPSQRIVTTDKLQNIQLSMNNGTDKQNRATFTIGKRQFSEIKDQLFLNSALSYCYADPACLASGIKDVVGDISAREHEHYIVGELILRNSKADTLYLSAGYSDISLDEATMRFNLDPNSYYPMESMYDWSGLNPLQAGIERHIVSATLQNEHEFSERLRTTLGLRYDNYNDVGSSLTPRLAGIWSIDNVNLIKAQYSSAFRPPTFYEIGGAIDSISPSKVDTYELSYIARQDATVTRLTGYASLLKDMIVFVDNGSALGYVNSGRVSLRGVELEHEQHITSKIRVDGNLSVMRVRDEITGDQLPHTARILGHLAFTYMPSTYWILNGQYSYVGPRRRDRTDVRPTLDAYQTLDITLSLRHLFKQGTTLRTGVRNLFDSDIRYPAPTSGYTDDLPRSGRYWWCGLQIDY